MWLIKDTDTNIFSSRPIMSQIQVNRSLAFLSKSKLDEKKSGAFFRVLKRAGCSPALPAAVIRAMPKARHLF